MELKPACFIGVFLAMAVLPITKDTVKVDSERSTINLPGKKKRNIREVLCSGVGFDPEAKRFISKCSCLGVAEIKVLSIPNGKE